MKEYKDVITIIADRLSFNQALHYVETLSGQHRKTIEEIKNDMLLIRPSYALEQNTSSDTLQKLSLTKNNWYLFKAFENIYNSLLIDREQEATDFKKFNQSYYITCLLKTSEKLKVILEPYLNNSLEDCNTTEEKLTRKTMSVIIFSSIQNITKSDEYRASLEKNCDAINNTASESVMHKKLHIIYWACLANGITSRMKLYFRDKPENLKIGYNMIHKLYIDSTYLAYYYRLKSKLTFNSKNQTLDYYAPIVQAKSTKIINDIHSFFKTSYERYPENPEFISFSYIWIDLSDYYIEYFETKMIDSIDCNDAFNIANSFIPDLMRLFCIQKRDLESIKSLKQKPNRFVTLSTFNFVFDNFYELICFTSIKKQNIVKACDAAQVVEKIALRFCCVVTGFIQKQPSIMKLEDYQGNLDRCKLFPPGITEKNKYSEYEDFLQPLNEFINRYNNGQMVRFAESDRFLLKDIKKHINELLVSYKSFSADEMTTKKMRELSILCGFVDNESPIQTNQTTKRSIQKTKKNRKKYKTNPIDVEISKEASKATSQNESQSESDDGDDSSDHLNDLIKIFERKFTTTDGKPQETTQKKLQRPNPDKPNKTRLPIPVLTKRHEDCTGKTNTKKAEKRDDSLNKPKNTKDHENYPLSRHHEPTKEITKTSSKDQAKFGALKRPSVGRHSSETQCVDTSKTESSSFDSQHVMKMSSQRSGDLGLQSNLCHNNSNESQIRMVCSTNNYSNTTNLNNLEPPTGSRNSSTTESCSSNPIERETNPPSSLVDSVCKMLTTLPTQDGHYRLF